MAEVGQNALHVCSELASDLEGLAPLDADHSWAGVSDADALNGTGSRPSLECQWGASGSSDFFHVDISDYSRAPQDEQRSAGVGESAPSSGSSSSDPNDQFFTQAYPGARVITLEAEATHGPSPWVAQFARVSGLLRDRLGA